MVAFLLPTVSIQISLSSQSHSNQIDFSKTPEANVRTKVKPEKD